MTTLCFNEKFHVGVCTLWNESLCPSGEDVPFVALQLDASLLGKGSPVMNLKNMQYVLMQVLDI